MRFTRRHTRNGRVYERGDPYNGPIDSARFLYHRGIIEPDGAVNDRLITGPKAEATAWHGATDSNEPTEPAEAGSPQVAGEQEHVNGD